MATKHGRNSVLYLGAASGSASPVSESHGFKVNLETSMANDSAQGDNFETSLPGLHAAGVEVSKWFDTAVGTLTTGAINRTRQKFYAYPDRSDATIYWYGTGYLSGGGFDAPLSDIVDQAYTLTPDSDWTYVHP